MRGTASRSADGAIRSDGLNEGVRMVHDAQMSTTYDKNGVDVTLVRWTLSLTPRERLAALQSAVDSIWRLKNATKSGL